MIPEIGTTTPPLTVGALSGLVAAQKAPGRP